MQGQAYLNLLALVRWTADDHVVYGEVVQQNAHLPDMHKSMSSSARATHTLSTAS